MKSGIEFVNEWNTGGDIEVFNFRITDMIKMFHQSTQCITMRRNNYFTALQNRR